MARGSAAVPVGVQRSLESLRGRLVKLAEPSAAVASQATSGIRRVVRKIAKSVTGTRPADDFRLGVAQAARPGRAPAPSGSAGHLGG